jgi:predicted HAD superfamily phosphohydrolase YqeG
MIKRIIFSIKKALKHQSALRSLPSAIAISSIDWQALYQSGIRIVVLDFDGVLAADQQQQLHKGVDLVLRHILNVFADHVYIYSNQPTLQRKTYFAEHFPQIQFLVAKKKPYPDGLLEVVSREHVQAEAVVLVDDRVLTGGLATILAGTQCILIKKPYICFKHNCLREFAFCLIRIIERFLFH